MLHIFILMLTVHSMHVTNGASMEDTKSLLTELFKNYSEEVRPVHDQESPVNVEIDLSVNSINAFDEVTGVISITSVFYIFWKDESLVWSPDTYGNLTSVTFSQKKIWLPQIYLTNAAETFEPISHKNFKVTVTSNGSVVWAIGGILKSTCTPDVSKFPFDKQTCKLSVTTWGYSHKEISISVRSSSVNFTNFNPNVEWTITGSSTKLWKSHYVLALFYFSMNRKPLNFLVNVVLPIVLLSLVNPFVFVLPYASGERTSYSITVLLSFSVYMTMVSDRMPASSAPMSYLSYYLFCMLTLSVLIVIINICQTRTHSKNEDDESVPQWICFPVQKLQNICRGRRVNGNVVGPSLEVKRQVDTLKDENKNGGENIESDIKKDGVIVMSPQAVAKEKVLFGAASEKSFQSSFAGNDKQTWHVVGKNLDKIYFVVFHFMNATILSMYLIIVTM